MYVLSAYREEHCQVFVASDTKFNMWKFSRMSIPRGETQNFIYSNIVKTRHRR